MAKVFEEQPCYTGSVTESRVENKSSDRQGNEIKNDNKTSDGLETETRAKYKSSNFLKTCKGSLFLPKFSPFQGTGGGGRAGGRERGWRVAIALRTGTAPLGGQQADVTGTNNE